MKIDISTSERELFIKFDGITHFRCDRRELIGFQSWNVNRGRETPVFAIQLYTRSSASDIILEYDDIEKWKGVLSQLDGVSFLNEWKVQDP